MITGNSVNNRRRTPLFIAAISGTAILLPAPAFAMHISEGILPISWAALWYAVAVPFVAWGLRDLRRRSENAGGPLRLMRQDAPVFPAESVSESC